MFAGSPDLQGTVDNCLIATVEGGGGVSLATGSDNPPGMKLRLTRNTLVYGDLLALSTNVTDRMQENAAEPVVPALVETHENVCQVGRVFTLFTQSTKYPQGIPEEAQLRALPKLIQWRERNNVYALEPFLGELAFVYLHPNTVGFIKDLAEWNQFWGLKDTGSLQGPVRLRGNPKDQLAESPETITPDDFRLRPDSAGYRAGQDGKDLGADVDLVGPGPAYERWKKTPEYQQWIKETEQVK